MAAAIIIILGIITVQNLTICIVHVRIEIEMIWEFLRGTG